MMFLTAGKCSEKGASDIGVFSPKPAKSIFNLNYGHGNAQAQSDGKKSGSHVPGLHQKGFSGVTCQRSASQRKKEKQTWLLSPADGRTQNVSSCPPWGWASLVLTRLLSSRPAWYQYPWSPSLWVCLPQPREKHWVPLAAWTLGRENPAWGSCTNTAWFWNGAHWWRPAWAQVSTVYPHAVIYFNFWWAAISHGNTQEVLFSYSAFHEWISNSKTHSHCYWLHKMCRAWTVFSIPLGSLWAH